MVAVVHLLQLTTRRLRYLVLIFQGQVLRVAWLATDGGRCFAVVALSFLHEGIILVFLKAADAT
jgi:hypothetical protein